MIIVKLIGGLGNQLFQYAIGRHLAEIHNCNLYLDLSEFENYKLHCYSLFPLNIKENLISNNEIANIPVFKEKHFHFDPDFKNIPNDVILRGYWQSEKYFIEIKDIIYSEFSIKEKATGKNLEILEQISTSKSVSIHIRRGDYVKNTYDNQILISAELDYYFKCVDYIVEKLGDCHFFVFSDDHSWVKNNLRLSQQVTYVDHNDSTTNYEDLRLMSSCKHNIISNSSFSWWAAWLNNNEEKIIYAPKKWFSDNANYIDSKDILPDRWIKI